MAEHLRDRHGRFSFATSTFSKSNQDSESSRGSPGVDSKIPRPQSPLYASTVCESSLSLPAEQKSCFVNRDAPKATGRIRGYRHREAQKMGLLEFTSLVVSAEGRSRVNLQSIDFEPLLTASLEPPVTKASLSELDITRILHDSRLRHDLNFERDVAFRPNYDGDRGRKKKALAKEYWTVLAVEFAIYIERAASLGSSCLLDDLAPLKLPWRLPQMFRTIQAILKTLVRSEDQLAVDEVFDIELLVQQLEKGVCDLVSIADWLGAVLKRSCSPARDTLVGSVIDQIRQAVCAVDPVRLAHGIEQLFGVLETMKLDIANHQIRFLRPVMINESTYYEQRHFIGRIAGGMEVVEARNWYDAVMSSDSLDTTSDGEDLAVSESDIQDNDQISFARTVVDLICDPASKIPNTFVYDKERIQSLRADFQKCLLQTIITESYCRLLRQLQYLEMPSLGLINKVLLRVWQIDQTFLPGQSGKTVSDEIILEITRSAYETCCIETLPRDEHMAMVRSYIQSATVKDSDLYHDILASTWDELDILIEQEVESIQDLQPLQILNHYRPNPSPQLKLETLGLHSLAQRIAHVAVLHWRVWGPILYLQPRELVEGSVSDAGSHVPPRENAPRSSVPNSKDSRSQTCSCSSISMDMDTG